MKIREEESKLFSELKLINQDLIEDGIVNEDEYISSKFKIIYVLKEVNGGKDWNLREFLQEGGRGQTWNNIARWTEGILKLEKDIKWDRLKENNEARRKKYLKKIGVINLKKTSGGVSNKDEVLKASIKNSDFLRKQIDIYKPDIIICCGTEEMVKKSIYSNIIIKWKITSRGIWYFENKNEIVISYSHPAAHIKASFLHYALMDAVREIVRKQESLI